MSDPKQPSAPTLRQLVSCSRCSRQYDATGRGPEERFRCRCGEILEAPPSRSHDAGVVRCSSCGGPRQKGELSCVFCGADFTLHEQDLFTVCPACTARISDRAKYCHHCGTAILPEEDARELSDRSCPSCGEGSLLSSRRLGPEGASALECSRCAGLWLGNDAFATLERRARSDAIPDLETRANAAPPQAGPETTSGPLYRPCPICGKLMNRRNYGRRSGVVIDLCKEHGCWFDDSELTRILTWIRDGGLERQRQTEREELREEQKRDQARRARARESPISAPLAGSRWTRPTRGIDLVVDLVDFLAGFRWRS